LKIIYLTDVSQLNDFYSNSYFRESYIPLTGDIAVTYDFIKKDVYFLNEWDFISNDEIKINFDRAYDFSREWWKELSGYVSNSEDYYFSSTQQDMVYSFEAAFNAQSIYTSLFLKHEITEIHGYFLKEQAVIRTGPNPTHKAVRSIAQSILFWICNKHSIPVYYIKSY
jgi:hypothetical protein